MISWQKDTFTVALQVADEAGAPVNISPATFVAVAGTEALPVAGTIEIVDAIDGRLNLLFPADALRFPFGRVQLRMTMDGITQTIADIRVAVQPSLVSPEPVVPAISLAGLRATGFVGSPAVTQIGIMTLNGLTLAPTLGTPAVTQVHLLDLDGLQSAPTVAGFVATPGGTVALQSLRSEALVASGAVTQNHSLAPNSLTSAAFLEAVSVTQSGTIFLTAIQSSATLAAMAVTQQHSMTLTGLRTTGTVGALFAAPEDPAATILLYRIGQSNAVTASTSAATATSRYGSSLTNMFIWNNAATAWQAYTFGVNTGHQGGVDSGAYSVEAEIVYQMRLAGDTTPVYVIKEAVSGNGVDPVDSNGNWWPGGTYSGGGTFGQGTRWTGLLAQKSAALAASGAPVAPTEFVLFNQGEADIKAVASAAREANMTAFFAKLRADLSATAKVIIERCRPGIDGSTYGGADRFAWSFALREGDMVAALADGNAALVDADFTFPANTAVHPAVVDTDWIHVLGQRVRAEMAGTYTGTYGAITDAVPTSFAFADGSGAASTVVSSDVVTVTGVQRRAAISVTGGEYRLTNVDGSLAVDWTSSAGNFEKFQSVQVRGTSSATTGATVNVTLTIGGVSDTFTITTSSFSAANTETTAFLSTVATNGGSSWSVARQEKLDDLYTDLKAASLLTKIKCFFIGASVDAVSGSVDLIDQTTVMAQSTAGGSSPVPWSSQGWNPGNVNVRGLNCFCDPSAETSQNDVGLFVWLQDLTTDAQFDIASNDSTLAIYVQPTAMRVRVNTTANMSRSGMTNGDGFYAANRTGATTTKLYRTDGLPNGAVLTTASLAPTATSFWLGSPAGSGTNADRDVSAHGVFTGMSDADVLALRNALVAFFAGF